MFRRMIAIAIVAAFAGAVSADYVADRRAAIALVKAGQHEEALVAFAKMAAGAVSDVQRSDAWQQAALCASSLKQYDRAHELAKKIPVASLSKACRLRIMETERRWKDIVVHFKDEDIASWPESVQGDAFFGRGHAYFITKNGPAATQDLQQAVHYITDGNTKGLCLLTLGDTYRDLLKDDSRALDAYRLTYGAGNVYKHCQAAINVASILKHQKKYDAALREFDRISQKDVIVPFWRGRMLVAMADVLVAAGKKGEAVARYNEALRLKDVPDDIKMECQKALKSLRD